MRDPSDCLAEHQPACQAASPLLAQCGLRPHDPFADIAFQRAIGSRMWDEQGDCWIDLTCGFSVSNFGHAHPQIVETARLEVERSFHLTGQNNPFRDRLAESLVEYLGTGIEQARVVLQTSGARALETAIRAATRWRPGQVVSLWPGFHGNSVGTWPLSHRTSDRYADGLRESSRTRQVEQMPSADDATDWWDAPGVAELRKLLQHSSDTVSALVVDPALATRGFLFPPAEMLRWIRQITRQHGIVLIADEIQSGLGRCGGWLLSQRDGWSADLTVVGKSLGGGVFPIAAVLGPAHICDTLPPGAACESFAGSALGCRLACQVLDMLSDRTLNLFDRGEYLGRTLRARAAGLLAQCFPGQYSIGGRGAVCTIELAGSDGAESGRARAARLVQQLRRSRLRVHWAGIERTRIVLLPALTMSDWELGETCQRLADACHRLAAHAEHHHPE